MLLSIFFHFLATFYFQMSIKRRFDANFADIKKKETFESVSAGGSLTVLSLLFLFEIDDK